jgi:gliding motility-associated-like protein
MIRLVTKNKLLKLLMSSFYICLMLSSHTLFAEGSLDVNKKAGKRLFLYAYDPLFPQQIKVFAKKNEFLNLGSSHIGLKGGFIKVYSPSGQLVTTFDDPAGAGIINNNMEEAAGPNGGGTVNGSGFKPAIVPVTEEGVWTLHFSYPDITYANDWKPFKNLDVNQPWTRDNDQPKDFKRVILAWDVTVSKVAAANEPKAELLKGRVFSNDWNFIINENGNAASPNFYVLSREGFVYNVAFTNVDPWGFPITSNNVGIVNAQKQPTYKSVANTTFKRTANINDMVPGNQYYYEPQARDTLGFVNNKIFLSEPAKDLPKTAKTTDIFRKDTHTTWLLNDVPSGIVNLSNFEILSTNPNCSKGTIEFDKGANFNFTSDVTGSGMLFLDLNNNGSFEDAEDVKITSLVNVGKNQIFWNGKDGKGATIATNSKFEFNYKFEIRSGEVHILFNDVENNPGGTTITRLNGIDAPSNDFYYNHSSIGGTISGGGTSVPQATNAPFTYMSSFGNERMLDFWTYINFNNNVLQNVKIEISPNCNEKPLDTDKDGIVDEVDLDDDNDGVSDVQEFCNLGKNFTCLVNGTDPSADDDFDRIPNYKDAKNSKTNEEQGCVDANKDGVCDAILAVYDIDGDNVPDHLDLDSDNDGITDLDEAGHKQPDTDRNGVIDGLPNVFGINGLYDVLDKDPTSLTAGSKYTPWDTDGDAVPDHDDLDSDNDGINDIREADFGYELSDNDSDGRIDVNATNPVDVNGLPSLTSPIVTKKPIGYPKDFDGDGIPDWHDLDSDNDGINDVAEASIPDPDNDGIIGDGKPKVNPNGIATADAKNNPLATTSKPTDTDKDGTPDWHDLDSDNDGIKDVIEAGHSDPDNDGIVGTGKPKVNVFGQPNEGNKSITPDFDGDNIPDFRDIDCGIALAAPIITANGKACPESNISLFAQSEYDKNAQFIWINAKGDTLATSGKTLVIATENAKAISPYSVQVIYAGCKSKFANPLAVEKVTLPAGALLNAINDEVSVAVGGTINGNVTKNDNISDNFKWTAAVVNAPKNGTLQLDDDGKYTYVPKSDFSGADEFEYKIVFADCPNIFSTAKVKINVLRSVVLDCFIPNLVTPNADGDNDTFFIPCADSYPESELTVYNRWGSVVYATQNYRNDWQGTYNGTLLPAGTYYYTYKLKPSDKDCQVGYLTIIRE